MLLLPRCASPEFLRARTIDVSGGGVDARAVMIRGFLLAIGALRAVFLSQADLVLENLALRQQLAAFARRRGTLRRTHPGRRSARKHMLPSGAFGEPVLTSPRTRPWALKTGAPDIPAGIRSLGSLSRMNPRRATPVSHLPRWVQRRPQFGQAAVRRSPVRRADAAQVSPKISRDPSW